VTVVLLLVGTALVVVVPGATVVVGPAVVVVVPPQAATSPPGRPHADSRPSNTGDLQKIAAAYSFAVKELRLVLVVGDLLLFIRHVLPPFAIETIHYVAFVG